MAHLYTNAQWFVDEDSVGTLQVGISYAFGAQRLLETTHRTNGTFYDWPLHMAVKNWVDLEAFLDAFQKAIDIHAAKLPDAVDRPMLEASLVEARRLRAG